MLTTGTMSYSSDSVPNYGWTRILKGGGGAGQFSGAWILFSPLGFARLFLVANSLQVQHFFP